MPIYQQLLVKANAAKDLLYGGDEQASRLYREIINELHPFNDDDERKMLGDAMQGLAEARFLRNSYSLSNWTCFDGRLERGGSPLHRPWDREDCPRNGSTILVRAEQGLGDTIQFARFIPWLCDFGFTVIFECQKSLKPLFAQSFAKYTESSKLLLLTLRRDKTADAGDYQVYLCSLPSRLTRLGANLMEPDALPHPYLSIDVQSEPGAYWSDRVRRDQYNVGIVWKGSDNEYRPNSMEVFRPLLDLQGVRFHSLVNSKAGFEHISFSEYYEDLADFEETASLTQAMDLVISVDTSGAHLAAALGVPTFTIVHSFHDWRWGIDGSESRWYPGRMILYRVHQPHQLSQTIHQIRTDLEQKLAERV